MATSILGDFVILACARISRAERRVYGFVA
jgi:hypothetical protein